MKLEIKSQLKPITIWGQYEPQDHVLVDREVWLDGKRLPKSLEVIFLAGLDSLTEEHLAKLWKDMRDGK